MCKPKMLDIMALSTIPVLAVTGFFTIGIGFFVLIAGYLSARHKSIINHKKIMILSVFTLAAFLVQYIVRAAVLHQETLFEGPTVIRNYFYIPTLIVHITFAIITIVLISIHLTKALKNQQPTEHTIVLPKEYRKQHRRMGRITLILWLFSYLGGIIIFILLYLVKF